jgi:hypothetical protein
VLVAPGRMPPTPPPARTRATGTNVVPPLATGGPNTWSRPSRSATVATMSDGAGWRDGWADVGWAGVDTVIPPTLPFFTTPGYGRIAST